MSPFLQGALGDPINLRRRIAQQASRSVPAVESLFCDFRSNGGPLTLSQSEINRMVIATGGEPLQNLTGKRNLGGGPFGIGDVDPSNVGMLQMAGNVLRKYDYSDLTGYYRWKLSLRGATSFAPYLTILNDNDVLPRERIKDVLCSGMDIGATPNGNYQASFPFVAGGYDLFGAAVQTSGSASTLPFLQNTFSGNWVDDATDQDVYVKRISNSGTAWTLQARLGAGSFSSSSPVQFVANVGLDSAGNPIFTRIVLEDGTLLGSFAEQIAIHFPASATGATGDIFRFPKRRAAWAQTLNPDRPISSVETAFFLNGEEIRFEGGAQLKAAWGYTTAVPNTPGRQGATVDRGGALQVTLQLTRRITDLRLQKALHEGQTVSAVLESKSSVNIGATGKPYRALFMLPSCRIFGDMYDVAAGGQNKDEAPTLHAAVPASTFTYDGISTDSHFCMVLENDIQQSTVTG